VALKTTVMGVFALSELDWVRGCCSDEWVGGLLIEWDESFVVVYSVEWIL